MGFRFRRSIRILPGIRLNFGKRGVSTSVGLRGAHVTVGHGKVRETVGIPGSGISYTHVERTHQTALDAPGEAQPPGVPDILPAGKAWRGWLWIALAAALAVGLLTGRARSQSADEKQEVMNAALRLKKASVMRTLDHCKAKGVSTDSCNSVLEAAHKRELKLIERLGPAASDPNVNVDEMNRELAACWNLLYGYVEAIECWSQLADRLDLARKGQFLFKRKS